MADKNWQAFSVGEVEGSGAIQCLGDLEGWFRATKALRSVEVVRDGQGAKAWDRVGHREAKLEWNDARPERTRYYYLRVTLEDGEMAWSSPI